MSTNILKALINFAANPVVDIVENYKTSNNRINSAGEALEFFVKDLFSNSLQITDFTEKYKKYSNVFSYTGGKNTPPDIMIEGGDAIEVKKLGGLSTELQLNSSFPKDKLYVDNHMLTAECVSCENWEEKDFIYTVGIAKKKKLKALWFVYGDCFAANKSIYEKLHNSIANGLNNISDIEFSDTKELARVNGVDPLGITYLRIRSMWAIRNPMGLFSELESVKNNDGLLSFVAIMKKDKYLSFPSSDREKLESLTGDFIITDEQIPSPNNPAELLDIKLIRYIK